MHFLKDSPRKIEKSQNIETFIENSQNIENFIENSQKIDNFMLKIDEKSKKISHFPLQH